MVNSFITFLDSKGLPYDTPDKTLVQFSFEGLNFLFQYREQDDPQFIRLLLPKVEEVDESDCVICKRMIEITSSIKAAKCVVINNEVWISVEQFVTSKDNVAQIFDRMMSVLILAYKQYASAAVNKSDHQAVE